MQIHNNIVGNRITHPHSERAFSELLNPGSLDPRDSLAAPVAPACDSAGQGRRPAAVEADFANAKRVSEEVGAPS
jgi:hypothetical protein